MCCQLQDRGSSKVSSQLFPVDFSFPTCNSYPYSLSFCLAVGTRDFNPISLFVNFCVCRNRLSLWNYINMGLVAFVFVFFQMSKETASSTPVWNLSSHQIQTASLTPAAAYSPTWTPVTQIWMCSNPPGPVHCKSDVGLPAIVGPWAAILPRICSLAPSDIEQCLMNMIETFSLNLELG